MRTSIVPAQITTVEDKIAGNISIPQAILLGAPILFGFIIALIFPPTGQFVSYKIAIVTSLFIICSSLAIKIRGRIVAKWITLFAVYCARPRYHIYDKNVSYLRNNYDQVVVKDKTKDTITVDKPKSSPAKIAPHEFVRLEQLTLNTKAGLKFEIGKKGELNVHITEVE